VEPEQALEEIQQEQQSVEVEAEQEEVAAPQAKVEEVQEKPTESFFARLKRSLSRTKANIGAGFFGLFKGKQIDEDLFEELE
ncbi:signal recognition particle-docking protein FtsY, partial [Vibrio sp. 10N.222.54.F6]